MNEMNAAESSFKQGFHVIAKPIGPLCNLGCTYCFYLEKQALFGSDEQYRMSDEILSAFIANYITSQPTPLVEFVWQGGEPALMGLDFFRQVVKAAFIHRRKMLRNSLAEFVKNHERSEWPVAPERRPESLSIQDWIELGNFLTQKFRNRDI